MSKTAQLADGTTLQFPDETPDALMDATVKRYVLQSKVQDVLARQKAQFPTMAEDPAKSQSDAGTYVPPGTIGRAIGGMSALSTPAPSTQADTPEMMRSDGYANVMRGIPQAVTGMPGALSSAAGAVKQALTGGGTSMGQDLVKGMLQGMLQPAATPILGAMSGRNLQFPGMGSVQIPNLPQGNPSDPSWAQAQQGAGAVIGGAALDASGIPQAVASKAGDAAGALQAAGQKHLAVPLLNGIMDIKPTELQYGRNPGLRLSADGVMAPTKEALLEKMQATVKDVGQQLEAKLTAADPSKTVNAQTALRDAIDDAKRRIGMSSDPTFQAKLNQVMTDAVNHASGLGADDFSRLSPIQAQRLKSAIGKSIKWTGAPFEGDINQALVKAYGNLNDAIESKVPGTRDLLAKYGDYEVGSNGLERSIAKDTSGQGSIMNPLGYAAPATAIGNVMSRPVPPRVPYVPPTRPTPPAMPPTPPPFSEAAAREMGAGINAPAATAPSTPPLSDEAVRQWIANRNAPAATARMTTDAVGEPIGDPMVRQSQVTPEMMAEILKRKKKP